MKLIDLVEDTANLSQIEKFLQGSQHNAWLKVGTMKVYVRKGFHYVDGATVNTFDLASIEQSEKQRGKGKFRQLVIDLKDLLTSNDTLRGSIKGIFVESVLNDRLADSLPSMGFNLVPRSNPPCFYMKL